MLALVTCHIFPPSIWYGKKWIPGTWLPGWQLAVFQSPRLHECSPADAHGNAQPFCMDKCIFRKKHLFFAIWPQNSSICPISSYLWMVDLVMRFFSCGASLWRSSTRIRPKKGPAPWILFLTPAPRPLQVTFFWLVKLNICGCTLLQGQMHFQQKHMFNRQKLISCPCTSGSFQEKKSGPFLVWYFIPGPISCPGTLTHCLLDFWKIVFFKKRTESPGKKTGSTEEDKEPATNKS